MCWIKIFILIGAVYVIEQIWDRFKEKDKLIFQLESIKKKFQKYQMQTEKTLEKMETDYTGLAVEKDELYKQLQEQIKKNNKQISELVKHTISIASVNERLCDRLKLVSSFLSDVRPSQEECSMLKEAIRQDIKLKDSLKIDLADFDLEEYFSSDDYLIEENNETSDMVHEYE